MVEAESKILLSFAKDLESLVKDFREEMEILNNENLMKQIRKTQRAKKKGELLHFDSGEDFLREVKSK